MIKILDNIDFFPLLLREYLTLENKIQWTVMGNKGRQCGIQYKLGENPWDSAVGKVKENEQEYVELNAFFKNTLFEDIINKYKLKRARLMWVNPYSCYSMHEDPSARIHVPLITNSECYFVFKEGIISHIPIKTITWVDTRSTHTFINCSEKARLHLVGAVDY